MSDINELRRRMDGAITTFKNELKGLRTGRASPALLEGVTVEAYGDRMPLNQVGTVGAPEPRLLTVQVWDKGLVAAVEKAIQNAGLGLNPAAEGQTVRIPTPELTEERRQELVKIAHKYAENARVAIRNVRRDGMDDLKKREKNHEISQDEMHKLSDDVQKLTDELIKLVDTTLQTKEKEIMTV
ncbi:MAG: ribosome recycling factor [Rickettsiales bacterium]|nr:ribosome recycling factor [Rickettsiales bacterium]